MWARGGRAPQAEGGEEDQPPEGSGLAFREEGKKLGQEAGQRSKHSPFSPFSRTVVEVTGHAHVLLAAFEKVSAVLPLAWEGKRGGV